MKILAQKSRPEVRWLKINRGLMWTRLCQKFHRVQMALGLFKRRMIEILTRRGSETWRRLEIWVWEVHTVPKDRWQNVTVMTVIFWNEIMGPVWAQKITWASRRMVPRPQWVRSLPKNQKFPPLDIQSLICRQKLRLLRSKPLQVGRAQSKKKRMWTMIVEMKYLKS